MKEYQCKIVIKNSKPPVWWRCLLPGDISFSALSIILDELTGTKCEGDFSFDMLRVARIWEPTKEKPLKADYYHTAYNAAHTSLKTVFDLGKTVNYRCGDQTYRIEIENAENGFKHPMLLLLKVPWHVNGLELSQHLDHRIHISKDNGIIPLRRYEVEEAAKDGAVQIGLVQTNLEDEQTVKPSIHMLMGKLVDLAAEEIYPSKVKKNSQFAIADLLMCYSKADLRAMARNQHLLVSSGDKKEKMSRMLADHLLKPETIYRYFSLLTDQETEAFERVLKEKGPFQILPEQEDDFDMLRDIGYVFIGEDLITDIPKELHSLYPKICDEDFHERRHKINWIRKCLNKIIPPYYSMMPMRKLCRICRRTNPPVILAEEVPDLAKAIPEDYSQCVIRDDMVYSKQLIEDPETLQFVKKVQADKPYYIMREQEIEELLEYGYPQKEASYRRFRDYLSKEFQKKPEEVDEIIRHLHDAMAFSYRTEKYYEILSSYGIQLSLTQVKEIQPLLQDMSNNTPTFYNRGYTPKRMGEISSPDCSVKW